MGLRHIDPAIIIGAFLIAVLLVAFGFAHLVDKANRVRIKPD